MRTVEFEKNADKRGSARSSPALFWEELEKGEKPIIQERGPHHRSGISRVSPTGCVTVYLERNIGYVYGSRLNSIPV